MRITGRLLYICVHFCPFCRIRLIHIVSKTRNMVPIILTPSMCEAIDCIMANQSKYVKKENNYMFAMPHSEKSYMWWTALTTICKTWQLENSAAITSTNIRKNVASSSQVKKIILVKSCSCVKVQVLYACHLYYAYNVLSFSFLYI